jgi:hypothetical protein
MKENGERGWRFTICDELLKAMFMFRICDKYVRLSQGLC